jgi:hypothetical protein
MIMAGHQPNYLPWLGFFDKMRQSDIFVIEDNVQFETRGFTNRNKIKEQTVSKWLTVPIEHTGTRQLINQVKISHEAEEDWAKRHWLNLKYNYSKAPHWAKYRDFFEETYNKRWTLLIDLNMHLIKGIMGFLRINTPLIMASSLNATGKKSDLILAQCKAVGADVHLAGNGARGYLDVNKFAREGIKVVFQNFEHPVYRQLHGEFISNLSVVDCLFCTGVAPWCNKNISQNSK